MQNFIPYNPYMTAQQRLYQMEQQYPQFANNSNSATVNNSNVIPVTNIDEANAFRVDPTGIPTFFYNAGKNEIYMKRTNTQTGLADFLIFSKLEKPRTDVNNQKGINTYKEDFKALNDKIDGLYSLLATAKNEAVAETIQKGGKNAK